MLEVVTKFYTFQVILKKKESQFPQKVCHDFYYILHCMLVCWYNLYQFSWLCFALIARHPLHQTGNTPQVSVVSGPRRKLWLLSFHWKYQLCNCLWVALNKFFHAFFVPSISPASTQILHAVELLRAEQLLQSVFWQVSHGFFYWEVNG